MTKLILMVTAGLGCFAIASPSAVAQTSPFLALNVANSSKSFVDIANAKSIDENPIHFCGENVPTNLPAVTERWTRTLIRQASLASSLALLKRRASVVFPIIEPILNQYQIPSDFKFLPLLESAVTNRAVSRKGAAGFWQLMPQTAQSLGLSTARRRDERFNLRKATHAACRYLNELYDQFGSWMLVATAYNAGPNYIQQLSRQHPDMHPMALPYRATETKAYLFQAVAVKELLTRPQAYRNHLSTRDVAVLTDLETPVLLAERTAILASFDMDETAFANATADQLDEPSLAFVADSTTSVVLLTEDELIDETTTTSTVDSVAGAAPTIDQPNRAETAALAIRLTTRSLSEGTVAEGQMCTFQVVQPMTIGGRTFAVGDVIHAHVEIIDAATGRVFLRTDRFTTALTQETFPLALVATEQPKQPGVALPARLEGWRLNWEQL